MDLQITWFVLLLVLFIGYVVLDGFDLGVGMLHLTAKTDKERRIMFNSIGPVWDANEVWLITAGGALFAAFPDVYATVFSGFYVAFMLFLLVIIGRAVSIEFRGKVESVLWKKVWDYVFNISSYLIVLLLGLTLGNIVSGLPVDSNKEFAGTFWGLFNPYSLFVAITAVLFVRLHGRVFLLTKTEDNLFNKILTRFKLLWILSVIAFLGLTIWTIVAQTQLLANYNHVGSLYLIPVLAFVSLIFIYLFVKTRRYYSAFISSSLLLAFSIMQAGIGIYPNLIPSKPIVENSLTIFNSSSSESTLYTMLIIACIGIPLVIVYKIIMYSAFRGKVKLDSNSY
ncbi:cytochrome d ubiquinol oxidase subunit II [Bacteroidetes/Chlorobi group bacterium ChocPot_Mid]|nr:MAG: cytochrome d ubiquinol oxidase subunit II [Bacteroidetes/Chlorobi group bacterium ChocPot_Mid]